MEYTREKMGKAREIRDGEGKDSQQSNKRRKRQHLTNNDMIFDMNGNDNGDERESVKKKKKEKEASEKEVVDSIENITNIFEEKENTDQNLASEKDLVKRKKKKKKKKTREEKSLETEQPTSFSDRQSGDTIVATKEKSKQEKEKVNGTEAGKSGETIRANFDNRKQDEDVANEKEQTKKKKKEMKEKEKEGDLREISTKHFGDQEDSDQNAKSEKELKSKKKKKKKTKNNELKESVEVITGSGDKDAEDRDRKKRERRLLKEKKQEKVREFDDKSGKEEEVNLVSSVSGTWGIVGLPAGLDERSEQIDSHHSKKKKKKKKKEDDDEFSQQEHVDTGDSVSGIHKFTHTISASPEERNVQPESSSLKKKRKKRDRKDDTECKQPVHIETGVLVSGGQKFTDMVGANLDEICDSFNSDNHKKKKEKKKRRDDDEEFRQQTQMESTDSLSDKQFSSLVTACVSEPSELQDCSSPKKKKKKRKKEVDDEFRQKMQREQEDSVSGKTFSDMVNASPDPTNETPDTNFHKKKKKRKRKKEVDDEFKHQMQEEQNLVSGKAVSDMETVGLDDTNKTPETSVTKKKKKKKKRNSEDNELEQDLQIKWGDSASGELPSHLVNGDTSEPPDLNSLGKKKKKRKAEDDMEFRQETLMEPDDSVSGTNTQKFSDLVNTRLDDAMKPPDSESPKKKKRRKAVSEEHEVQKHSKKLSVPSVVDVTCDLNCSGSAQKKKQQNCGKSDGKTSQQLGTDKQKVSPEVAVRKPGIPEVGSDASILWKSIKQESIIARWDVNQETVHSPKKTQKTQPQVMSGVTEEMAVEAAHDVKSVLNSVTSENVQNTNCFSAVNPKLQTKPKFISRLYGRGESYKSVEYIEGNYSSSSNEDSDQHSKPSASSTDVNSEQQHSMSSQKTGGDGYPMPCYLCQLSMRTKEEYVEHLATIHYKLSYQCPKCAKHLSSLVHMNHHLQISCHYKDLEDIIRPFKCRLCPGSFSDKRALTAHQRREHGMGTASKFECKNCRQTFTSKRRAEGHEVKCREGLIHKQHQGDIECPECGKFYSSKGSLSFHKRMMHNFHVFSCVCGQQFRSSWKYYSHRKTCEEVLKWK